MKKTRRIVTGLLMISAMAGCRPDDQRTDSVNPNAGEQLRSEWPAEVVAHVDAGNAAIRADSFEVAKTRFLEIIEMEPELAVGWFGLYMAEQGLGNAEAAAAALEEAQRIQSGASLIHPENEEGGP